MGNRRIEMLRLLTEAMRGGMTPVLEMHGDDAAFVIDYCDSFRRTIILKNAEGVPDSDHYIDTAEYISEAYKHYICGEIADEENVKHPFTITFSDVIEKIDVYNAFECTAFFGDPWDYICDIAYSVIKKAELDVSLCNSRERELLPILGEMSLLSNFTFFSRLHTLRKTGDGTPAAYLTFPYMHGLAVKYGCDKILNLLDRLESISPDSSKYQREIGKLKSCLCEQKNEPLWRELFDKIRSSQEEYPNKIEIHFPADVLSGLRESVEGLFHERGYDGAYPDFVKKAPMRGIHLEESYGTDYLVGMEKRVFRRIHCIESLDPDGQLRVQFLTGTALLRRNEEEGDIYSCLFNAKGRRIYHTVNYSLPDKWGDASPGTIADLEVSVNIAAKKAELRRLDKAERLAYHGHSGGIFIFLSFLIIAGGMFAAAMMTCAFIILSILTLTLVGPGEFASMMQAIPWLPLFLFAWISFGVCMGLVTVLCKTK